jgi:hypothetical protein
MDNLRQDIRERFGIEEAIADSVAITKFGGFLAVRLSMAIELQYLEVREVNRLVSQEHEVGGLNDAASYAKLSSCSVRELHEASHRLGQLCVHLIRDCHDIGQQQTKIQ